MQDFETKNNTTEELKEFRIEALKRLIPELSKKREKNTTKRFLVTFITMYLLIFFFLIRYENFKSNIVGLFFLPLIISFFLMFISFVVGSFTFCKNQHEAMIIEKLKTELFTLINRHEDAGDMLLEIDKIRNHW